MRVAEITHAEAVERARLLRVEAYRVSLDLTQGDETFRSTSVIRFSCAEPTAESHADLVADTVHEIILNGHPIDPATAYRAGRITLHGLAAENELLVTASCAYGGDGGGLSRFTDSADGRVYTYTNFEPADARRVYADFEQPDLKAVFHLSVTAPAHWTVLSNMPSPERGRSSPEGTAIWTFPPTPRLSTYLVCLCAGEYTVLHDTHTTARGQVIPLEIGVRASLAAHLEPEDLFGITKQGLDYFTELFASDLPFPKYGQIFVPEFRSGAMENPGLVTISEQLLFRSKATAAKYELRAMIIMHEMAHMWFGDHVTMKWWGDLWLNESFAEFCGSLATAEATRFSEAWTTFVNGRKTWGYAQDQLPSTHPIAAEVGTLGEAIANFDGISYAKGASVLKALVAYVGREQFFAGVRAYFAEYAGSNASLGDLVAKLERASGMDLSDWSKAWLETAGVNTLSSAFELDESGAYTAFAVLQSAPETHPHLRPHHIAVGLYNLVDGALIRTRQLEVEVIGACTSVPELVGVQQPDLLLLNDDDLTFALIEFDPRSLATLAENIGRFADSLARAISWGAVVDMAVHAKISVPTFVRMLTRGMGTEDSVAVLQSLHQTVTYVIRTLADPAWVLVAKSELAESAFELLHAAEPGGDLQLSWAQLLARTATTPPQLDFLSALLSGAETVQGLTIGTDLRWMLLRRLTAMGRAGDREIDAELERDPTDQGHNEACGARAAIPDLVHKTEAWRLLTETELGTEAVLAVANGFGLGEHAELTSGFTEAYFRVLPTLWAERPEKMRALLADRIFPYNAASPRLLELIDAFAANHNPDPALKRFLMEARDFVKRILKSRALC